MFLMTLLLTVNFIAGCGILLSSLYFLNQMTKWTPHSLRAAYIFLAAGSFCMLLDPLVVQASQVLLKLSMAYILFNMQVDKCKIAGTHKTTSGV